MLQWQRQRGRAGQVNFEVDLLSFARGKECRFATLISSKSGKAVTK